MDCGKQKHDAAREVAFDFEATLRARIADAGISGERYHLEITACGTAEGEEFASRADCVYVEQLTCHQGGKGDGGRIMRLLTGLADERGLTVVLEAASQKFDERNPWWKERLSLEEMESQAFRLTSLSQEDLEAWYRRLGFALVDEDGVLMARKPVVRTV